MNQRGFTLIETLVYLALFTLIIGGFVAAAYMLFETSDRNQTKAMMQEEANFLVGKLNWVMSGMQSVTTPLIVAPATTASDSTLIVTKYDGSAFTVFRSGADMQLNGETLNNSNVTISKLVFIHTYAGGANPESIEAGFTISAKTPTGSTISEIASTTRYIRK